MDDSIDRLSQPFKKLRLTQTESQEDVHKLQEPFVRPTATDREVPESSRARKINGGKKKISLIEFLFRESENDFPSRRFRSETPSWLRSTRPTNKELVLYHSPKYFVSHPDSDEDESGYVAVEELTDDDSHEGPSTMIQISETVE